MQGGLPEAVKQPVTTAAAGAAPGAPPTDHLRESVRNHLARARELLAQGKWAEAGKELDAIEVEVRK